MGVEQCVSVVHEAKKKNGQSLLGVGEAWGMVGLGHLLLLCEGRLLMAHFLPHAKSLQHTSSDVGGVHSVLLPPTPLGA